MAEPNKIVSLDLIYKASKNIKGVIKATPLMFVKSFSDRYHASIPFKRQDLQVVHFYKLRGAYNKIKILSSKGFKGGVVCASAGNHAQVVAFAGKELKVKGVIFRPLTTPRQKVNQVRMFGEKFTEIKLIGDTYDESYHAAKEFCTSF